MKRILSSVFLCVMIISCTLTLVSCVGPNKNYEKAADALTSEGYIVEVTDDLGEIEAIITASNEEGEFIMLTYFMKRADAKEAYEEAEGRIEEYKALYGNDKLMIKRSGRVMWIGTKNAAKAAR